jgi:hypothetical protein
VTNESVDEEETLEEEQTDSKKKNLYDEQPIDNGWKVSGTVKNQQIYRQAPFIRDIVQVGHHKLYMYSFRS